MGSPLDIKIEAYWKVITFLRNQLELDFWDSNNKMNLEVALECVLNVHSTLLNEKDEVNRIAVQAVDIFGSLVSSPPSNKPKEGRKTTPLPVINTTCSDEPAKKTSKQKPTSIYDMPSTSYEIPFERAKIKPISDEDKAKAEKETKRGDYCLRVQLYDDALVKYNRAIRYNPGEVSYFYRRGLIHSSLYHHREAITDLERAIQLDPTCGKLYGPLAIEYLNQGLYKSSKQALFRAINHDPNDTQFKTMLEVVESQERYLDSCDSSPSDSPRLYFNTQHPQLKDENPPQFGRELLSAATIMLSEPGAFNVVYSILEGTKTKRNPVIGVLMYKKGQIGDTLEENFYRLPLNFKIETYEKSEV